MKKFLLLAGLFLLMLSLTTPAQAGYTVTLNGYAFNVLGAGRFNGSLTGTPGPADPGPGLEPELTVVNGFWCVDNQHAIDKHSSYTPTFATTLDTATFNANINHVEKGNEADNGWLFDKNGVVNGHTMDALFRYRMAAALIAGLGAPGYDEAISRTAPQNTDTQRAIWGALNVDTVPGLSARNAYYIDAMNFVGTHWDNEGMWQRFVTFTPIGADGKVRQALMGQVPEPAFLGLLAVGLSAVYLARRRRTA